MTRSPDRAAVRTTTREFLVRPPIDGRLQANGAHGPYVGATVEHAPQRTDRSRGRDGDVTGVRSVTELVTYRRLALSVIQRAFKDLTTPLCRDDDRDSARAFLSGSDMLLHWCDVAALDPARVIARAVVPMPAGRHTTGSGVMGVARLPQPCRAVTLRRTAGRQTPAGPRGSRLSPL